MILSTHIVSDVEATATHIALVNKGQLLREAAPENYSTNLKIKFGSGLSIATTCPPSNKNTLSVEPSAEVMAYKYAWSARTSLIPVHKMFRQISKMPIFISSAAKNEIRAHHLPFSARRFFGARAPL